jgi:hypothetical protein
MNKQKYTKYLVLTALIILALITRFMPHLPNVSPIMAIALFGGFYFEDKRWSLLIPLSVMFISDLYLGLHTSMITVYLSVMIGVLIGTKLSKSKNPIKIGGASIVNSIIFFILTNFSVWLFDGIYALNFAGLADCYVMAIPFFRNALLGDLAYVSVLFGTYYMIQRLFPRLIKVNI